MSEPTTTSAQPEPELGAPAPEPGEVPASTGGVVDLDRVLGRIPVVLVFVEPPDDPPAQAVLRSLADHLADYGRDRVQVLAVARRDVGAVGAATESVGNIRMLADPDGTLATRFGAGYQAGRPTTVLVDAAGRIAAAWVDRAGGTFGEELLERIELLAD